MTTRLPDEPLRVTSWLAGWVDYVFAMVLVAGRWLRLPVTPADREPAFRTAFAPTMHESFDPHWGGSDDSEQRSGPFVKVAEIVMLSVSFFLAAHLLSGGASTAVAPNLNRLLGSTAQAQAQGQLIASTPRLEITVPPSVYAGVIPAATVEAPPVEQATVLEPPAATGPEAASVQQAEPAPTQAPAAVDTAPQPTPPPAAIAPPPPAPAVTAPTPVGRYLSSDEVRAAAIAAGWPANLVEDAVNVAWCESRFHNGAEYGGALGLMQMMPFWFTEAGLNPDQWSDPVVNLKAALFAFREHERNHADPWGPWTCKPDHGLAQPD